MFSLAEINEAKKGLDQKIVYSIEKSVESYDVAQQTEHDRGYIAERLVYLRMIAYGLDATHTGATKSHDIELYVDGAIVRGESKSSLLGPNSNIYSFKSIKPEFCDIIYFVFVHPTRGLVVKTARKEDVVNWIETRGISRQKCGGYTISFNSSMNHKYIPTVEWELG